MSSHPSLRHLYDFSGWVIQEIQVTQKLPLLNFIGIEDTAFIVPIRTDRFYRSGK
jgi:hypothetical protein